jgi:uncharacterized protein YcgL (UPF0745 family)
MSEIVDKLLKEFGKPDSVSIIKLRKSKDVYEFIKRKKESEGRKLPNIRFGVSI